MPNLDNTGPRGQGPATGRKMGKCVKRENGSDEQQDFRRGFGQGFGRGFNSSGRGMGGRRGGQGGRGGGRGGQGIRNRFRFFDIDNLDEETIKNEIDIYEEKIAILKNKINKEAKEEEI